jgi:hypothetical protein
VSVLRCVTVSLVVALVAMVASLFPAEASAQRGRGARRGRLVVLSAQQGAEVFIDEQSVGTLPIEPQSLAPGDHTLRVTRPGYTDFTDVVRITAGGEATVEVELIAVAAVLHVESTPPGAQIFVDGRFVGTTPGDVELADGTRSVRVRLSGYHEVLRQVTATPGERTELVLPLEVLPPDEDPNAVRADPDDWYEKPWTWVGIGGGAVAVAVGIALIVVFTAEQPSQLSEYCGQPGGCVRLPTSF